MSSSTTLLFFALLVRALWSELPFGSIEPAVASAVASPAFGVEECDSHAPRGCGPAGWSRLEIGSIDDRVFDLALGAMTAAVRTGAVADPATLTVIDYSLPSTTKRLWVFDLRERRLLYEELVAHGKGSGENYATQFSNQPQTLSSSLGLFVTDETYVGKNGYSLRLDGLEHGWNDRARERTIVMHGAPYVSADFASSNGRLGRSWGCPALPDQVAREIIDRVKGGGLLFAYYPEPRWLSSSRFLDGEAAPN